MRKKSLGFVAFSESKNAALSAIQANAGDAFARKRVYDAATQEDDPRRPHKQHDYGDVTVRELFVGDPLKEAD